MKSVEKRKRSEKGDVTSRGKKRRLEEPINSRSGKATRSVMREEMSVRRTPASTPGNLKIKKSKTGTHSSFSNQEEVDFSIMVEQYKAKLSRTL